MIVTKLLAELYRIGVQVQIDGDRLRCHAPVGVLTPELREKLVAYKDEIIMYLRKSDTNFESAFSTSLEQELSWQTISCIIGTFTENLTSNGSNTVINPRMPKEMAQKTIVTFKSIPNNYNNNKNILAFQKEILLNLEAHGVKILPWEQALVETEFQICFPLVKWKKIVKKKLVKSEVNAIIDIETNSLNSKIINYLSDLIYRFIFSFLSLKKKSFYQLVGLISLTRDYPITYLEDPFKTQIVVITEVENEFLNPNTPYIRKIVIGLNTLVRTMAEIVIGVSDTKFTIINMNLSDDVFVKDELDSFVLSSFIPKIFAPIKPPLISKFEIFHHDFTQLKCAKKLINLGNSLEVTGLLPPGSKFTNLIKRKSNRDIISFLIEGRTGNSYGFIAYAEPPQYIGQEEIDEHTWINLTPVKGLNFDDTRQNNQGRWYVKTKQDNKITFKQIPDIYVVSSRSGSNKTNLCLEKDIVRIGLKKGMLFLDIPKNADICSHDIRPSFDTYAMLAISLSTALYIPKLIENGMPIVHFHGYPLPEWFQQEEYYSGTYNPSVPCGTIEGAILNFWGIYNIAAKRMNTKLVSLIEPGHGTNVIASDVEYLIERLKDGCKKGKIELGGKHFKHLKEGD